MYLPLATVAVDGYKTGHKDQYPFKTEFISANFTPRSPRHLAATMPESFEGMTVVFGNQVFVIDMIVMYFQTHFFTLDKKSAAAHYKRIMDAYLGKGVVPIDHIEDLHDLGYLPLCIKGLPEGTRVKAGTPVLTIINTDRKFFWLTNYIETLLSCETWKPHTIATIAYEYKRILLTWAEATGAPKEFVQWQLHDFSMRGMSGLSDAVKCAMAHLALFFGTDTVPAIPALETFYKANLDTDLVAGSVPATEHSVMCAGSKDGEYETFLRLLTEVYPEGIVSVVSDTWDYWTVLTDFLPRLREVILNRKPNALGMAKLVIRPDSGDPVHIVAGYNIGNYETMSYYEMWDQDIEVIEDEGRYYMADFVFDEHDEVIEAVVRGREISEAEAKGSIETLWGIFGGTLTPKGFRVLHERIGLIYGDSITTKRADEIMRRLFLKGFASNNVVFGVGSYSYQYISRDSLGFAVKATGIQIDGTMQELFKDPKTDSGTKKSAKGFVKVVADEKGEPMLVDQMHVDKIEDLFDNIEGDMLQVIYKDGKISGEETLANIRSRLDNQLMNGGLDETTLAWAADKLDDVLGRISCGS